MKNRIVFLLLQLFCLLLPAQNWQSIKSDINLFVANDLGRNGYYDQRRVAGLMGTMAEEIGPEAVLALGDVHHFDGVASISDPLWMTNYESIYSHPELMIAWCPILGNHEYRGNTQAVLDYSRVSRRWQMPARYYSRVFADDDSGTTLRVIFLDTTPLIDSYRADNQYADAADQDIRRQAEWLDSTLRVAAEDWVIVVGHHPIYAQTKKDVSEQETLQQRIQPILRKSGKVSMYVCGHIHNFQHIQAAGDDIHYVVNTAGSLSRKVLPITDRPQLTTVYCSSATGFSVLAADKRQLRLCAIDSEGKVMHTVTCQPRKN